MKNFRLYISALIVFIVSVALFSCPAYSQEVELNSVTPQVTNITPDEKPTLENTIFLIDAAKVLYGTAVSTIDDIKDNGLNASNTVILLFMVILPALILLLKVIIYLLLIVKIFTGDKIDSKIDKVIDKLSPVQRFLQSLKDRKKKA